MYNIGIFLIEFWATFFGVVLLVLLLREVGGIWSSKNSKLFWNTAQIEQTILDNFQRRASVIMSSDFKGLEIWIVAKSGDNLSRLEKAVQKKLKKNLYVLCPLTYKFVQGN